MEKIFLETERLYLREIACSDFDDLKDMLQDTEVMYAWEHCFTNEDVQAWIDRNLKRYRQYNLGYFILEHKLTGEIMARTSKSAKRFGYNGRVLLDETDSLFSCRISSPIILEGCLRSRF